MFLAEALRIGRILQKSSVRHAGRCTWFGDGLVERDGLWRRTAGALGADFASGTAGVGWFLARLSVVDGDPGMGAIAVEAFRQSLAGADELIESRRLGFHEGAAGVAWASCDAGRALGCEELVERGLGIARRAGAAGGGVGPGLWNGDAGLLMGLLGLSNVLGEREVEAAAGAVAGRLTHWLTQPPASVRTGVGLSYGASGIAAALGAWAARSNSEDVSAAARMAFRRERSWLSPGQHWYGQSAHTWTDDPMVGRSLCSGAAGIGLARLAAYTFTRAPNLLAEAAAAIEVIRAAARPDSPDASLCHGTAGEIELLLCAWTTLGEPAHLDAARRMGSRVISAARIRGSYGSGFGEMGGSPSLLPGLAGVGLVMLRLHDPAFAPCAALPSVLV